ncbi:SRPBCC family protein [Ornithinimicrobium sp. F0845]|uniref:SRPBCC family protein n=1 Tax=Ornithinimicrobium sp. F0845 TaxID=2926412 RepID=UPI001FF19955|nr:SRPBCC family protein [Ornithinimicrobium sp. F0845]MCK0112438.1 SRPBCC family protein [Ornithinimicrobium sp. F0845]
MTTPTSTQSSRRELDGQTFVEFTRTFRAPIEDVWAAVTESARLARWIGEWSGNPAEGEVRFRMLFEGEAATADPLTIDRCEPPRLLHVTTVVNHADPDPLAWHLRLALSEAAGVTTLRFAQELSDPAAAAEVGPGWDYYLDRLVAAETGGDPATINWDDYFPALAQHYRNLFA